MNIHNTDDESRTQKDWFEYFKSKKERMISYLDILKLNESQLVEVRKNFRGLRWEVTSSQVIYNSNGTTTIVHYADTNKPIKINIGELPVWRGTSISDVLNTKIGCGVDAFRSS